MKQPPVTLAGVDPDPGVVAGAAASTLDERTDPIGVGYLLGVLAGEGHFGGDGKQPQVTLRMHVRHEALFQWLQASLPGGRLYGPYHHGGRDYYQWMCRGSYLRKVVAPLIGRHVDRLDDHVAGRFLAMCARYGIVVEDSEHRNAIITRPTG